MRNLFLIKININRAGIFPLMQVKKCRIPQVEHSAILLNFIKLPLVIKIFVLSIFERPFYTGITPFNTAFTVFSDTAIMWLQDDPGSRQSGGLGEKCKLYFQVSDVSDITDRQLLIKPCYIAVLDLQTYDTDPSIAICRKTNCISI